MGHAQKVRERGLQVVELGRGVGHLVLDSFDEIARADALLDRPQRVLIRQRRQRRPAQGQPSISSRTIAGRARRRS